jgi:hypothetical protein
MRRVAALYASLQAVGIGWLASGGALLSSAHSANPADDGGWAQAPPQGTIEAYESYLGQSPAGLHAGQAFRCIVELTVEATEGECAASQSAGGDPLEGVARGAGSMTSTERRHRSTLGRSVPGEGWIRFVAVLAIAGCSSTPRMPKGYYDPPSYLGALREGLSRAAAPVDADVVMVTTMGQ